MSFFRLFNNAAHPQAGAEQGQARAPCPAQFSIAKPVWTLILRLIARARHSGSFAIVTAPT